MQNLQDDVQKILKDHKRKNRYVAFLIVLSMLVSIIVPTILIMPAVSMTASTEETESVEENVQVFEMAEEFPLLLGAGVRDRGPAKPANSNGWFDKPTELIPENSVDFTNNITSATIEVAGQTAKAPGGNAEIIVDAGDANSIDASFNITYTISKDGSGTNAVTVDNPCIYYQLPDGVSTAGFSGENMTVNDPDYSGYAGYYSISEDGLVVIQFTEDYIKNKIKASDSFTGAISFNGKINRANTADGDQTITVGGVTVKVTFNDKNFGINKSSSIIYPSNATEKPKITWTITISNEYGQNLSGYKVTDERFLSGGSGVSVEPANIGSWSDNEFVFNENVTATSVTFTFTEDVNEYNGTARTESNTATLVNCSDSNDSFPDSADANLSATYITKDGKPDYETGSMNNEINWTVTVTNPYGYTLNGHKVSDPAFSNATNIIVKDESGSDVGFKKNGNIITFTSDVGKAIITYTTFNDENSGNTVDGNKVTNTATLIYPDGTSSTPISKDVTYTNPYTLYGKWGEYSYDTGEITWTIKAECSQNNKKVTLNNYSLTDPAFASIDKLADLFKTSSNFAFAGMWGFTVVEVNDTIVNIVNNGTIYATIEKVGDTITIYDENPYSESITDENAIRGLHYIEFKYTTQRISAGQDGTTIIDTDGKTYVTNSISDNQGHSNTSNNVEVTDRDSIKKTLTGDSSGGNSKDVYNSDTGEAIETLNWQINVTQDTGFSVNDKVLVDVMNATNGGMHYITPDQRNNIKVYAKTQQYDSYNSPLDTAFYNITFYNIEYNEDRTVKSKVEAGASDNANSFEIIFTDAVDTANYKYVQVTYQTTADYTGVPDANDSKNESAIFSNTASFGDAPASTSSYQITKKDEGYVEKTSIMINKSWQNDSISDRPDSITFQLQRRLANSSEWETIYQSDDGTISVVTPDLTDESTDNDYTYSLHKSDDYGNWQSKTFENLPKETDNHDNRYYYRAIEVNVPDGYAVSYSNENDGINSDSFTITNTKKIYATYEKTAIDGNKKSVQQLKPADLNKVTVNGVEYYAVGWKVTFGSSTPAVTLLDTLPEGQILLQDYTLGEQASWNGELKYPAAYWQGNQWSLGTNYEDSDKSHYQLLSDGRIQFDIEANMEYIIYYTGVPVADVDAVEATSGYIVSNSITSESEVVKEAIVTITSNGSTPTESGLLDKTVNTPYNTTSDGKIKAEGGRIQYTINVNPEGKTLSNTGEYDITDAFIVSGCSNLTGTNALDALDAKLFSITVKDTAANRTLSSNEYQYTVEYKPNITEKVSLNLKANCYQYTGIQIQNIIDDWNTPTINEPVTINLQFSGPANESYNITISNEPVKLSFDENGKAEYCWIGTLGGNNYVGLSVNWGDEIIWGDNPTITSLEVLSATYEKISITSTAVLHLTVPDATPLEIIYTYDLTKGGTAWTSSDAGTEITASNSVSLNTGNVQANDSENETKFSISSSKATVTTGNIPQIVKYDINDYSLKLDADFWIAKYDSTNSNWMFSSNDAEQTITEDGTSVTKHVLTFDKAVTGDTIPEGARSIHIDTDEAYKVGFETGVLYKLVELKAPNGYQGMDSHVSAIVVPDGTTKYETLKDLVKAYLENASAFPSDSPYYPLLKNFISTHYFIYGNESVTYPSGVDASKVIQVKTGGSLDIPNNQLIDIAVQKSWSPEVTNGSVEVKLYWSYTKSSTGIPTNAVEATADDLGLQSLENPKTITANSITTLPGDTQGASQSWTVGWNDLPSGKDDRPIYYYVKETAYTVGDTTYTLQENGTYKNSSGSEGLYKPNYVGNATNKDGTIKINNSEGLTIQKLWKNSDNTSMDENDIPVDSINVKVYGVKSDGTKNEFFTKTLSADNDWKLTLTNHDTEESGITLSDYVSIQVEEVTSDNSLYGYVISYTYNLNGTTGEATIINKNNAPTETSVTVNKVWSDGNDAHASDILTVKLYQSTTYLTSSQLEHLTAEQLASIGTELTDKEITLSSLDNWTYTWSNLPYQNESKTPYNYYVLEEWSGLSGENAYTAVYTRTNSTATNTAYTITNSQSGKASVQKEWKDSTGAPVSADVESISVDLYRRLAETTETDDSETTGQIPSSLKVAAVGDSITNGYWPNANPYPTQLETLLGSSAKVDNYGNSGEKIYDSDSKISTISKRVTENTSYYSNMDVMIIMGGTNDINSGIWESYSWDNNANDAVCNSNHDEVKTAVENMIKAAYNNADTYGKKKDNTAVFIASIPYEDFVDESTNTVKENINYCGSLWGLLQDLNNGTWVEVNKNMDVTLAQSFENEINKMIDSYNSMLKDVVTELQSTYPTLRFVDINKALNKSTMLYDGVHPNNDGYAKIAETFYNAIATYYGASTGTGTSETAPTNINKLPDDFYTMDANGNPIVDSSKYEYVKTISLSDSNSWIDTFDTETDYVYYVVETGSLSNWTVAYQNNGVTEGGTITITNTKEIAKTSISVEKKWVDAANATHSGVSVKLYRKLSTASEWETNPVDTITLLSENDWKYTWSNLAKEDASGTPYVYKVEETVPDGYSVSYTNNDGINSNTAEEPIVITNTKTFALSIKKDWAGGEPPTAASVKVEIHRSTNVGDAPTVTTISTITSETTTTTTTTTTVVPQPDGEELTNNAGNAENFKSSISGLKVGDVITVTMYGTANTSINGCFGFTNNSNTWENSQWGSKNIGSDGKLTISYEIPSSYPNGNYFEFQIWSYSSSTVTGVYYTVSSSQITTTTTTTTTTTVTSTSSSQEIPNETTTTQDSSGGETPNLPLNGDTITSEHTVSIPSGYSPTDITVQFKRTDTGNTNFYVNINGHSDGGNINNGNGTWEFLSGTLWGNLIDDQNYSIATNDGVATLKMHFNSGVTSIAFDPNKGSFELKYVLICENSSGEKKYVVYPSIDDQSLLGSALLPSDLQRLTRSSSAVAPAMDFMPMLGAGADFNNDVATITISMSDIVSGESWVKLVEDLPAYDENNQPYYYWVEEVGAGTGALSNYEVSYLFTDGDDSTTYAINAANPGAATATIRNTKTQNESYELPSTGGIGTRWYTISGLLVLGGGCGGFATTHLIRRFRKRKCTK